ncbi:MAG: hypothetical protein HZB80_06905 [Deltaproteobacteria bacterium]|nr:hypothetical protein [Deltaproteobacteria bacterium]
MIAKGYKMRNFILVIASVLICGLISTSAEAVENHNSSRSNKTFPIAIGYNSRLVSADQANIIMDNIGQQPPDQINEQKVLEILKANRITGINKIIVERKGSDIVILLLRNPQDESAARASIPLEGKGPRGINVRKP